jgi:hypothetical protein
VSDPHSAVNFILKNSGVFAKAKADRIHIEEFRKSKKALLMNKSTAKSAVEREQYAYSHPEYIELLDGLKAAIEIEETLKWKMTAAELSVEIWRSENANNRNQDKVMR